MKVREDLGTTNIPPPLGKSPPRRTRTNGHTPIARVRLDRPPTHSPGENKNSGGYGHEDAARRWGDWGAGTTLTSELESVSVR